jgi:predicted transcriptional regulator of viral defense system
MTQFEKLDLLLRECGGTIQTFQVLNNGISKSVFYAYVKERGLEQAAHGVYVSPDTWTDAMYLLHLRCGQAVFSHETALFFHDLTDREPLKYTITVRTGYNPSRLQEDGFQVYTVKKDLHEIGIIAMQTSIDLPFSNCCSSSVIRCSVSAIAGSRCLISVPIPAIADFRL